MTDNTGYPKVQVEFNDPQKTHVEILVEELREQLRQRDALLAECVGVMDKHGLGHPRGCGSYRVITWDKVGGPLYGKCTCDRDQTLAALKSRIAALTGGG